MISATYRAQFELLLKILPYVAREDIFALTGGTAINLFVRDLPRLSVDIDLTYLQFDTRDRALKNIHEGLGRIKKNIEKSIHGLNVNTVPLAAGTDVKLNCQYPDAQIKIEVNTITRGHLFPVRFMKVSESAQNEFGKFAAMNIVSHAELFGGKICAALDRQHPRDLFDIKLLLNNEGITDDIWHSCIIALFSHHKPVHELLDPVYKNQESAFYQQFSGMTKIEFDYKDYEETRTKLSESLKKNMTERDKRLIYSFENGQPDWSLFPYERIKEFPAIRWKLSNLQKPIKEKPDKHRSMMLKLEEVLKKY